MNKRRKIHRQEKLFEKLKSENGLRLQNRFEREQKKLNYFRPNYWLMKEDWIKCQIAELEKLLERCKDNEIMRISLQFRIDEFKKELKTLQ